MVSQAKQWYQDALDALEFPLSAEIAQFPSTGTFNGVLRSDLQRAKWRVKECVLFWLHFS
jgi:hypothetical protein